jgi:hypothetical protein
MDRAHRKHQKLQVSQDYRQSMSLGSFLAYTLPLKACTPSLLPRDGGVLTVCYFYFRKVFLSFKIQSMKNLLACSGFKAAISLLEVLASTLIKFGSYI